ncbi:hypothetical protein PXK01_08850 [Phaeobacter sp. PT47_59]|uniref:hypothetical protein n=1 Tax=Phaeobacter sp. PT47_59 TaxID=3029979 RepID=UPI002380AD06|nr:hypothetical protein [Phaeobacter sp. PT47_59]MDE4174263.1 hypothetical protein [Phaeobacter sp. PT47_59]
MSLERTDYPQMARELAEGRLGPEGFSHRAHLGVAYEILSAHEVFDAMAIYARGLRQLASAAGVPEKFNATVTLGFLSLTAERMANGNYDTAEAFLDGNADLLAPAPLSALYGAETLGSDLARRVPLLPRMG